jgi:hypothetical protein
VPYIIQALPQCYSAQFWTLGIIIIIFPPNDWDTQCQPGPTVVNEILCIREVDPKKKFAAATVLSSFVEVKYVERQNVELFLWTVKCWKPNFPTLI